MIGRENEKQKIKHAINSTRAELGILYGRRRIGKSTLLESLLGKGDLYFEAVKGLPKSRQIEHFLKQLSKQTEGLPLKTNTWEEAFDVLTKYIQSGKHYVVFDEFPWMASEKSELVSILKYYWDRHWKKNNRLTLVLCGSVAQFMVKHLVCSEALHNRKTFEMKLGPLPAHEAQEFFKGLRSNREIADYLMIFGGVPKYLEQIDPKDSFSININRLCLRPDSFFHDEIDTLFKEQFKTVKTYALVVRELRHSPSSKEALSKKLGIKSGGGFKSYLDNLERADFIKAFSPLGLPDSRKSRTKRYYLWDEWLRFHHTFIAPNLKIIDHSSDQNLFHGLIEGKLPAYLGLAFEKFCLKNIDSLIACLEIPWVEVVDFGPFFRQGARKKKKNRESLQGLQIDILIVRKKKVLTLIECKYSNHPIGTSVIDEVRKKIKLLRAHSEYTIERVLIAPGGVTEDLEEDGYFHRILGLDFLFQAPRMISKSK